MSEKSTFENPAPNPWCGGCGHTKVIRVLQEALAKRFNPRDVVLVTDIGCIGMADKMFTCHTVHGLHGRSPALGAGIAVTRNDPKQKVVVLMGDGGAAIGLQHILDCARINVNMTLVICNNQTYGMTGGQHSAYTVSEVRTVTTPDGASGGVYDICRMVENLDVMRARATATSKELPEYFDRCLTHDGFSVLETINYCPAYSGKMNPERLSPKSMEDFLKSKGLDFGVWPQSQKQAPLHFKAEPNSSAPKELEIKFEHQLSKPMQILLAGTAGEGVQRAADVFAEAACMSGLHVALRGIYPVTVGKGFSASILALSPEPILSTTRDRFELALVTSEDGLRFAQERLAQIDHFVVDTSLAQEAALAEQVDFRGFGRRQACMGALVWAARRLQIVPDEALAAAVAGIENPKVQESYSMILT